MLFPPQPSRPFTREGIESINPGQSGCYGLFRQSERVSEWVYVGSAADIRLRLLEHLTNPEGCVALYRPTHFLAAITRDGAALEKRLLSELRPICNQQKAG